MTTVAAVLLCQHCLALNSTLAKGLSGLAQSFLPCIDISYLNICNLSKSRRLYCNQQWHWAIILTANSEYCASRTCWLTPWRQATRASLGSVGQSNLKRMSTKILSTPHNNNNTCHHRHSLFMLHGKNVKPPSPKIYLIILGSKCYQGVKNLGSLFIPSLIWWFHVMSLCCIPLMVWQEFLN